jgi:hypothetical protein
MTERGLAEAHTGLANDIRVRIRVAASRILVFKEDQDLIVQMRI